MYSNVNNKKAHHKEKSTKKISHIQNIHIDQHNEVMSDAQCTTTNMYNKQK